MITSSIVSLVLLWVFGWQVVLSWRSWLDFRDVRALRGVVKALMLLAGAMGLALGSYVLHATDPVTGIVVLRYLIGASRSALLIGGIYLLLTWRRR